MDAPLPTREQRLDEVAAEQPVASDDEIGLVGLCGGDLGWTVAHGGTLYRGTHLLTTFGGSRVRASEALRARLQRGRTGSGGGRRTVRRRRHATPIAFVRH